MNESARNRFWYPPISAPDYDPAVFKDTPFESRCYFIETFILLSVSLLLYRPTSFKLILSFFRRFLIAKINVALQLTKLWLKKITTTTRPTTISLCWKTRVSGFSVVGPFLFNDLGYSLSVRWHAVVVGMGEADGELLRRHRQAGVREVEDPFALCTEQGAGHRLLARREHNTGGPARTVSSLWAQAKNHQWVQGRGTRRQLPPCYMTGDTTRNTIT